MTISNPGAEPYPTRILIAAVLGAALGFLGASVVNVALPTFQTELGASASDIQWIVSAYNLSIAALLLSAGAYSDMYGHRRVFNAGLVLYAVASVICAIALTPTVLIAGRAIQGLAGALLVPASLGLVNTSYPPESRGHAVGLWSSFSAVGGGLGPLIGGLLIETLSWRYMFWINLPIVALVAWLIAGNTPAVAQLSNRNNFDWVGATASVVALGALTFASIASANAGITDPVVLALFATTAAAAFYFIKVQRSAAVPLMPLTLFSSRNFAVVNIVTFLAYCSIGGGFYIMMLTWIQIQGYSPLAAGAITLPFMLFTAGFAHRVGRLVRRIGPRIPLAGGVGLLGIGFISFALPGVGASFWSGYLPGVLLSALGIALLMAPLTTVVMSSVDVKHSGTASGVNSAVARSAILLSVAILGALHFALFEHAANRGLDKMALTTNIDTEMRTEITNMLAAEIPIEVDPTTASAIKDLIVTSFMRAARIVLLIAGGLSVCGAMLALGFIGRERSNS